MTLIQDIENYFNDAEQTFLQFIQKVKNGVQIIEADVEEAVAAIVQNIGEINSKMATIERWVQEILPMAQAAGLPAADAAAVNAALIGAKDVVAGLDAVAATVQSGGNDPQAVVAGIAAVAKASGSTNAVIAAVAKLQTPAQTTGVTR